MQTQTPLEMSIHLPCIIRFEKETKTFVSECPPLGLLSGADNEAEAVDAIQSAVVLYLQAIVEDNCIGEVLAEKGFLFTNDSRQIEQAEHFIAVRVGEEARAVNVKVPIGLLVRSHLALA